MYMLRFIGKLTFSLCYLEKYELVGKLLRKGEEPTNYDDDEDEENVNNDEQERKNLPKSKTETDDTKQEKESHILQSNVTNKNNAQDQATPSTDC